MTNIQEIYFQLLRKAIGFTTVDGGQCTYSVAGGQCTMHDVDREAVVRLAQIQGTAPLIFDQILSIHDSQCTMHDELRMQMKQVCMQNMLSYEKHTHLLQQVQTALHEAHLHPVLLKGFGLARLYPQPYLRSWGDLDIYVGPDQYHQAAAVLRDAFPQAKHHDEEWEELKHYNFVLPDGLIEMHRSTIKMELPRDKRIYYALEHAGCSNGEPITSDRTTFTIPEAKFNMLFTFMHAWYHFVEEGVGFKQIADVALLAHQISSQLTMHNAQWIEYLRTNLRKLHLMQPWQLMGYICVKYLGLPAEEWPLLGCTVNNAQGTMKWSRWLQKHGERFAQRVLTEGIARAKDFGDSKDRYEAREKAMRMNVIVRKWMTLKSRFRGAMLIWPYSPQYARHMLVVAIYKGIRRTIKKEKMEVMY